MELDWVVGWAGLWVQSFRFVMGWVKEIGPTGNSALTRDTEARRRDACRPRRRDRGHIPDYYTSRVCIKPILSIAFCGPSLTVSKSDPVA